MNAAHLAADRSASPSSLAQADTRAFMALVRKDLRLGAIVFVPCLCALGVVAAYGILLPLLGSQAMRSTGLTIFASMDAFERVGHFARAYWVISMFASILAAIAIAAGDSGRAARRLLPALPVSATVVYASKFVATALVVLVFVGISAALGSLSIETLTSIDGRTYAAMLGLGLIWAFAAPTFSRSFAGSFLVVMTVPLAILSGCLLAANWLVPPAVIETIAATEIDRWLPFAASGTARHRFFDDLIGDSLRISAPAVIAVVGLLGAWNARGVVLCRRGPARLGVSRILKVSAVGLAAVFVSTVATYAATYALHPLISAARKTQRHYKEFAALSTGDLVEKIVDLDDRTVDMRGIPEGMPAWSGVNHRFRQLPYAGPSPDHHAREAVAHAIGERWAEDAAGIVEAAGAMYADPAQRHVRAQLRLAELCGPRTKLSYAIRAFPEARSEVDRILLTQAVIDGVRLLKPPADPTAEPPTRSPRNAQEANGPREMLRAWVGDWTGASVGASVGAWTAPPFELRDFRPEEGAEPRGYPAVLSRAKAVIVLTALAQRLEDGSLSIATPSYPADRLTFDVEAVRKARVALERPFPELAKQSGAVEPGSADIDRASDDETLYLRASELFDRAKTDPSYLLP
jgi:hypothetical protein